MRSPSGSDSAPKGEDPQPSSSNPSSSSRTKSTAMKSPSGSDAAPKGEDPQPSSSKPSPSSRTKNTGMKSPSGSDAAPKGEDPQPSSSKPSPSSRDSNMASKLQNAASLTIRLLQEITDNFSESRLIGQGAYGTVYKGVHDNGEEIAVKLLHNNLQGTDDEQFKREFENLTRLEHCNIVQLVGYCYETHHKPMMYKGETIYAEETNRALCFEYMRNGSLQMHISDECDGLDWHTRYKIIKGTCDGLKYLHEGFKEPIYHMDLKPDNILLDEKMIPKLADFGLSKLYDGEQTMITQNLMGTIGYLPPEYLFEHLVSKKLDIFSLGVVMTKIITGPRGPTRRAETTYQEFIDQVQENWRKRLQESWRASQPLEAYCQQVNICTEIALGCMENDRHKRPSIVDIIHKLNETENMIKELETHWGHEWTRSYVPENPKVPETQISRVPPAEDDTLPGIDGLRITGEAFPGRELLSSGFSICGTTSCNFQWVRHLEDGSINFIEGAKEPMYLVTVDDVDSLLAVEVLPLDDRKRMGDIVKVYANDGRKITCGPEMKELSMKILSVGHVSCEVLLAQVKYLDMWEPAVLAIRRDGYRIKCNGPRGVVIRQKFQQATAINSTYGCPTEFSICSIDGAEYKLKSTENSLSRDGIVLIMRLFRNQTIARRRMSSVYASLAGCVSDCVL